jgi:hypothetical protein
MVNFTAGIKIGYSSTCPLTQTALFLLYQRLHSKLSAHVRKHLTLMTVATIKPNSYTDHYEI